MFPIGSYDTQYTRTSAGVPVPRPGYRSPIAVTIVAVLTATAPQESATAGTCELPRIVERTSTGPVGQIRQMPAESTARAILEIRRRSGLTWEELGDLFDVSRRSVHHWASGKPVSAGNDRMIRRILAAVRRLGSGGQADARARLLAVDDATGVSTFDLLKDGRFDEAMMRLEVVQAPERRRIPLSRNAQDARRPPAPVLLLEAEHGRPETPARARVARAVRAPESTG